MNTIKLKNSHLSLSRPLIMGILNVTPDSFSDGGHHFTLQDAVQRAREMIAEGADILDIGGESTRPGAPDVSEQEEINRVVPAIKAIKQELDCVISIDTSKANVMRQAVAAGADLINDVRALQNESALETAASLNVPVCLMHMQGLPRNMQTNPQYDDVISDLKSFFQQRIDACVAAGIDKNNIILDPGFGFGKTLQHNYQILARLSEFTEFELPLLIGLSRKSMIGAVVDDLTNQDQIAKSRLIGSVSAATIAAINGANIIRVHDVSETKQAMEIVSATTNEVHSEQ